MVRFGFEQYTSPHKSVAYCASEIIQWCRFLPAVLNSSRWNHKTPPHLVVCAFVERTRYTFMIQRRGGGLPLLLPLLGENPPKNGVGPVWQYDQNGV